MKEVIKITEQDGQNVVSARELHAYLQSKQDFTDWIKSRLDKYGFIEGLDFTLHKFMVRKSWKHEYVLSIDCAKEIAMVEGNEKGKQARRYFVEVEKRYRKQQVPTNPIDLLKLAVVELEKKEKQIAYLTPKAELMDRVLDADEKIDIGQACKILELPFGRNTMFQKLREKGVFFKNRNEPRQEFIQRGYFQLREKFIERSSHEGFVVIKVLVTQKGLAYLSSIFDSKELNKDLALLK